MLRWQLQPPKLPWETCSLPGVVLCWSVFQQAHESHYHSDAQQSRLGGCRQHDPCVNLRKLLHTELTLANCHHGAMILRRDCSVLSLLGMEKTDESSHLVKGIPAWRITAQGDVQNLPTLITLLLAASAMDMSPNCMIPFILNGFIPASPRASSCAAAWHQNGRRLRAAPGHHNKIRLLTELCCIMACDEYPGGKKFKLILCCLVSPF